MPGRAARAPRPDPLPALSGARDPEGEVSEWSKAPHSKCGVRATVPWVRIPPSPPLLQVRLGRGPLPRSLQRRDRLPPARRGGGVAIPNVQIAWLEIGLVHHL